MPERPFDVADPAVALDAIKRVFAWRDAVRAWLLGGPPVSDEMIELLIEALSGAPGARLGSFPFADATGPDPTMGLRAILLWRGRILSWAADVWDVVGEPRFGMEECAEVERVLDVAGADEDCSYCFAPRWREDANHFKNCAFTRASGDAERYERVWGQGG